MVYIHTVFFHLPLRERKKPPRLPLSETEADHYALFVLSQALTRLLAGVLDRSLGAGAKITERWESFFSLRVLLNASF